VSIRLRSQKDRSRIDGARQVGGTVGHPCVYDLLDFARLPMAIMEGPRQIVCYVNPALCDLTGKTSEEMVGTPFADIVPEGDKCLVLLDRVLNTGNTESHTQPEDAAPHPLYWSYEIWPVLAELADDERRAGVIFQVTETAPFHNRVTAMNEALLQAAVVQHELTETAERAHAELQAEMKERKLAQEALLRSELLASAGRFAASIAHEINNPLEAVMNILYLAQTTDGLPQVARDHMESAGSELMRIAHITRQTLGFYKESAAATNISASSLLTSVVTLLQAKVKQSGALVELQCDQKLHVRGVFGELRQVLANLLVNSLHAAGREGKIVLRASTSVDPNTGGQRVRVTVADSGCGIDSSLVSQIFEPFYTTKQGVGTGLGLWVCKQLVDKNGGAIRVRSNTQGKRQGTTFSIVLNAESLTVSDEV
jgi:two-component system, NtrC family, sensor kinase